MTALDVRQYVRWRATLPDLSAVEPEKAWTSFQAAHEGRCAICRQQPTATAKRAAKLILDHDHTTGYMRGLLCRSCNGRAGSGWRHERLSLSATPVIDLYVQFPPAAVCGLVRVYEGAYWADPADQIDSILWHAGPSGTESERDVRGRELARLMRGRDWAA